MARRVTHTNKSSGHDGTYVYRSTATMDPQNLPAPLATAPPVGLNDTFEYIDNDSISGDLYYRTQDYQGGDVSQVSGESFISLPKDQLLTLSADTVSAWTISEEGSRALINTVTANWHHIAAGNGDTGVSTGKYYFEIEIINYTGTAAIGIREGGTSPGGSGAGGASNGGDGGRAQYFGTGQKRRGGVYENYGAAYTTGDIVGILFDADTGNLNAYLNGVDQGLMYTIINSTILPVMVSNYGTGGFEFRLTPIFNHLPDGAQAWPVAA